MPPSRPWRALTVGAVAVALLVGCAPAQQNGEAVKSLPAIVPAPAAVTADASAAPFAITGETRIVADAADRATAEVLAHLIEGRTAVEPSIATGEARPTDIALSRSPGMAESYELRASDAGITIAGSDAAGVFYGAQTLGQLIRPDGERWVVPAVEVADAPRFGYRGVMLDVARHFFDVATVEAYIDRVASLKLNALHLHLTDDQGWRIQIDGYPLLTEKASGTAVGGDTGGFYTKDDYRQIVRYAASRHMIVVPEIDLPGHTHAVGLAYPELVEQPVISDQMREIARDYGGELPAPGVPYDGMAVGFSSLKIHEEDTYAFLADVFDELADLTPGSYLHVGGDEALGTSPEDFAAFFTRTAAIVAATGKTPVAWHEAGAAPGLPAGMIGQYWGYTTPVDGHDDNARAFVQNGGRIIYSPADAAYLDMKYDDGTTLGLTWANGPTSVERAYSWEPSTTVPGIGEGDVLGVEAPLWSETIRTLADIDTMAFPRAAAAAEIAWSPAPGDSLLRTWESFRARVGALGPLWASEGIGFFASPEIEWITE